MPHDVKPGVIARTTAAYGLSYPFSKPNLKLALVLILAGAACSEEDPMPPGPSPEGTLEMAVTAQLRSQLIDPNTLPLPRPLPQAREIIDEDRAVELARRWIVTIGPFQREYLEAGHHAPLDLNELVPSDRVFFAETPDAALPPNASIAFHKAYGPYYLVTFVTREGEPAVSIAVSAYNTDIQDGEDDSIIFPVYHGSDFKWTGVSNSRTFPLPPETAVLRVHGMTNARAAAVPVLVKPRIRTSDARRASRWPQSR